MTARARTSVLIAVVAFVTMATFGVAWAARVVEGRKALADADAALGRGDSLEAILAARVAAEARCPTCTAPEEAFAKLEKIARDAEARGDDTTAFAAWRATRAALLATAVLSTSGGRRTHADNEVARFAHRLDAAAVAAGATEAPAAAEDRVRAALSESDLPGGATFVLIALGGVVFFAFGVRFARAATRSRADLAVAAGGAVIASLGAALF